VAEYQDLGPRTATGVADPANKVAAGDWTVSFPASVLSVNVPLFEVYHMAVNGPGGYILLYRNEDFWDTTNYGGQNSWDPQQPLLLRPGDDLTFYWSVSAAPAPMVTIWLRHNAGL
jgi:hypothetical protein